MSLLSSLEIQIITIKVGKEYYVTATKGYLSPAVTRNLTLTIIGGERYKFSPELLKDSIPVS